MKLNNELVGIFGEGFNEIGSKVRVLFELKDFKSKWRMRLITELVWDFCMGYMVLMLVYECNCVHQGPGVRGGMPSTGVFLRYHSPYLREFRRKQRNTPNGWINVRGRELWAIYKPQLNYINSQAHVSFEFGNLNENVE